MLCYINLYFTQQLSKVYRFIFHLFIHLD